MQISIDWSKILPVIVSIGIIIAVAILRQYSKTFAAIAATMPINIPLGMWIVVSGAEDSGKALSDFMTAVLINIFPTLAFILAAWLATRSGQGLIPAILIGYAVWGVLLVTLLALRG